MNQFDSNLTKSLEDFMGSYKMVDVEQIYSNGTEFVPIFRVKQWLEYNNINNLQSKIDKANEIIKDWHQEYNGLMKTNNIYIPEDKPSLFDLRDILKEDK